MGRKLDLTGREFGWLEAIEPTNQTRSGSIVWKCICKCGKTCYYPANWLNSKKATSCGCKPQTTEAFRSLHFVDGTHLEAITNKRLRKNNTTGRTGVRQKGNKWEANICFRGKCIYLGQHDSWDDAVKAREAAEELYFKPVIEKYTPQGKIN